MSLSKTSKETLQGGKDVCEDVDDASSAAGDSSGNVDASKSNLSTTDTNQSGTTDDEIQNIKNALTKRESQQVFRLRLLVMLILIAAATSISFTIFRLERSSQLEEFESDYYGVAEKIITSLQEVTKSISAIAGLAVTVTVDAHNKVGNASTVDTENLFSGWPFITIDAFQERATNARAQAGSIFVSLNPIVESDQLSAWEKYLQSDVNTWM